MPKTTILSISDPQCIPLALKMLANHSLIAFPTDTIYGLAADAFDPLAIKRIFNVKQRSENKALPVLIGTLKQLPNLALTISESVKKLAAAFWPGPLTIVLPKNPDLPEELSPYPTIGIRMPNLAFTLKLLAQTGPLATTSANLSGGSNPVTPQDVLEQLDGKIDLLLDGGSTPGPLASTVIDATTPEITILRQGSITMNDLETILGPLT